MSNHDENDVIALAANVSHIRDTIDELKDQIEPIVLQYAKDQARITTIEGEVRLVRERTHDHANKLLKIELEREREATDNRLRDRRIESGEKELAVIRRQWDSMKTKILWTITLAQGVIGTLWMILTTFKDEILRWLGSHP